MVETQSRQGELMGGKKTSKRNIIVTSPATMTAIFIFLYSLLLFTMMKNKPFKLRFSFSEATDNN
jgi:hypothetical protein